jgi:uncharacterized membrane protein
MLWLSALPDIFINVLSTHKEQYSGFFQYNAVILPYLMVSAISGTAAFYHARRRVESSKRTGVLFEDDAGRTTRLPGARRILRSISAHRADTLGRLPIRSQWIGPLVIAWLIISAYWNITAPSKLIRPFWMEGSHPNPQQAQIDTLLASVPPNASVAATDSLDPHLSDRYILYLLPDPQSYIADYVAIDLHNALLVNRRADLRMYEAMLLSGNYRVLGTAGNVVLLERFSPTPAAAAQTWMDGWQIVTHRAVR